MAQVSLPDGTIIPDFPDNPTPQDVAKLRHVGEQMEARMRASTPVGALKEAGKVAGTAIADGVMGLPDLGGAAADWIATKLHGLVTSPEHAQKAQQAIQAEKAQGVVPRARRAMQPETELGQRAANVGSSVAGSVMYGGLGGASPGINVTSGLLGGVGSELLGKMSNPSGPVSQDDPMAKLAGGLGGGIGGALGHEVVKGALSSQPARERIARILSEGLTDRDFSVAGRRMQQSAAEGVPLVAPQAFSKTTNIDKLAELANRAPLTETRRVLNSQVDAMAGKASHELGQLPGRAAQPTELANRSRDKATKFFDTFKQQRAEAAEGFMPSLDVLEQSSLRGVNKDLAAYLAANPNKPLAAQVVRTAKQVMRNPEWQQELKKRSAAFTAAREAGGEMPKFGPMPPKYMQNPESLYGALDEALADAGKNSLLSGQSEKFYNRHAAQVRDIFKKRLRGPEDGTGAFPLSQHPELDAQKAAMRPIFEAEERALQEPVGKLANAAGTELGAPDSQSLVAVFKDARYAPRSTKPGQGEIARLQQQLAGAPGSADKTLFQDAVKTFFQDAVTESTKGTGTRNNPKFMEQLITKLGNPTRGGNDPRWRQTKDILLANAADMGLSPQEAREAAQGFEKLMVLAARTSQRGSSPGVNASTIMQEASPEALRRIGGMNVMSMLRQPSLWLQKVHEKRVLQTIDKWMTTPEGLQNMRELAKAPTYKQFRAVLNTIGQNAENAVAAQDTSEEVK